MRIKDIQAKELSDEAILALIRTHPDAAHTHFVSAREEGSGGCPPVYDPSHPDAPEKVLLAKLRSMTRRGLITGCGCGCRGDWTLVRKVSVAFCPAHEWEGAPFDTGDMHDSCPTCGGYFIRDVGSGVVMQQNRPHLISRV